MVYNWHTKLNDTALNVIRPLMPTALLEQGGERMKLKMLNKNCTQGLN